MRRSTSPVISRGGASGCAAAWLAFQDHQHVTLDGRTLFGERHRATSGSVVRAFDGREVQRGRQRLVAAPTDACCRWMVSCQSEEKGLN